MTRAEATAPDGRLRLFVDALNVAYWCGDPPSLRMPLALTIQLLSDGHRALMYFDASARYRLEREAELYARLIRHAEYAVEVPSGKAADAVMLQHATASGACILSNDRYRDYRKRYRRLIDDPSRLLSGSIEDERLRIPALGIDRPLPASVDAALAQLESLLPDA